MLLTKSLGRRILVFSLLGIFLGITGWIGAAALGFLDSGKFEIVESAAIAPDRIAMLARRSDHTALSGDTYFVIIGDQAYSARELRSALYSFRPVFVVDRNGLELHWEGPKRLVIECRGCEITKDRVQTQKWSSGDVAVVYRGFP